jgi:hypothetical protein
MPTGRQNVLICRELGAFAVPVGVLGEVELVALGIGHGGVMLMVLQYGVPELLQPW